MAYVVTQSCCADASCVVACPVNCIHPAPGEPGFGTTEMVYVDASSCVGCGACATACPVGAMVPDAALTTKQLPFLDLNASYYDAFPHADRTPVALVPQQRRLTRTGPFRVAVVGAGPAGLYTADELLKHPEVGGVDVYDRLRTPYGLVRHGVAPDHASTKLVTRLFEAIERQPRFRYFLDVPVGAPEHPGGVTLADLRAHYDAVVYAVGASADRSLGIPGEELAGSVAATALVGWYNGHPDQQALDVPLAHERAVVVGNGNVALDVARILARPIDVLERTDLAPGPLDRLRASAVREVLVLGRRGPAQAAFTVPELIGLAALDDVDVLVEADPALLTGDDQRSALLRELAERPVDLASTRRRIVLAFASSPVEVLGADGRVSGVRVARNELVTDADGTVRAVPTDDVRTIEAGLVVRSVGHRGTPVAGLPFDERTATVPNHQGRVEPGLYVVGWIKRGPVGFIGTNKTDAQETVETILDDLDAGLPAPTGSAAAIAALVAERHPQSADLAAWQRLDAAERERGAQAGRPRAKITDVAEQRSVAAAPVATRRRGLLRRTVSLTS
ncbi:FAD-dependent oxidoreductase [Pimelobacter simplex]|uniref:ferredoxin--NADP(+) reductase n=1 Tax=Nocardioides simplex TaxID=2045 RepID=A0A0A1DP78_NOCSI|nr:FAD-dependent oxidoreductase [Pimelobacter simplex]AIY19154.1 Ferredoxin [Pimelobacter simplex]MCG8149192.1 FAD-dependent oxidoreductase [Pimelobacter simplex]GEB14992.1 putative ferredoxin/ferredoxin--NADP reductase [Pimelobacter simplex]SFM22268.1 ferredoxin--NADP+ reductase [Pimelobacter simplex]